MKSSKNNAKDVEIKSVDLPENVKIELESRLNDFQTYLSGVIIGLGLKGKWALDPRKMQLIQQKLENK